MNQKVNPPHLVSQRQRNPYDEPRGPRRAVWALRLAFLFVTVTACGVASVLLYTRWRGGFEQARVVLEGGSAELSVTERLYLETYLAQRAAELEAPAGTASGPVTFQIQPGQSAGVIAGNLAATGVVRDAELFTNYLRYFGLTSALHAGTFQLSPDLTIPELAATLSNPYRQVELNFLPGWRLEEMASYLAAVQPASIDAEEFLAITQRRQAFELGSYEFLINHPAGESLEGFLYPDAYTVEVDATTADLVDMMLRRFGEIAAPEMRQAFGVNGLSLRQAVTLASIVERETPIDAERALIAGVFLNRIAQGMPLQADSTVQYAIGRDTGFEGWWKSPLVQSDLSVASRYNTYQIEGLPPGPIANPGLASLTAVAYPAETDFLFFVLDCESQAGHLFSVTFEEHLAHVQRCLGQ